jgi:hypothetical protein
LIKERGREGEKGREREREGERERGGREGVLIGLKLEEI